MSNNNGNIIIAHKQFMIDLHNDPDFLEFKKNCKIECGFSYGVVCAGNKVYTIQVVDKDNKNLLNDNTLNIAYEQNASSGDIGSV